MLARRKNAESRSVDLLPPACLRVLQENPRESLGGQPRNIVRAVEAMRGPFRVQSQTFVQLHERASFPAECGDEGFGADVAPIAGQLRSEEHTSELQSLMRISYAVFCLKKKKERTTTYTVKLI